MISNDIEHSCSGENIEMPLISYCGVEELHSAKPMNWRTFEGPIIHFITAGGGLFELNAGHTVSVSAGKYLITRPYQSYRAEHGIMPPNTRIWIEFRPVDDKSLIGSTLTPTIVRNFFEVCEKFNGQDLSFSENTENQLKRFRNALIERTGEKADSAIASAELRTVICSIVIDISRNLRARNDAYIDPDVQAAISYLETNFLHDIVLTDMIAHLGLKKTSFYHRFRELTGYTPGDYIMRFRVSQAQKLMARNDRSITEIALDSGFNSSSYFAVAFKKQTRQSPRDYRNTLLREHSGSTTKLLITPTRNRFQPVDLAPYCNLAGIYSAGYRFEAGLDGCGYSLCGELIPNPLVWRDADFEICPANKANVVVDLQQTIDLPQAEYSALMFLAVSPYSDADLVFKIQYADGSDQKVVQRVSNWCLASAADNESIALTMWHRQYKDGTQEPKVCYIYGYSFKLDSHKMLRSLTLGNSGKIALLSKVLKTQ